MTDPNKPTHYIVGSGSYGCLYDNGPHAHDTLDSAVDDLAQLFELGRVRRARLKADHYLDLDSARSPIEEAQGHRFGADYCEITECDCSEPWSHNEDDDPSNWPEYDQPEPTEPEEEDIKADDPAGPFFYLGKQIATDRAGLRAWMEAHSYSPNVWFISDHGNAHLLSHTDLQDPTKD